MNNVYSICSDAENRTFYIKSDDINISILNYLYLFLNYDKINDILDNISLILSDSKNDYSLDTGYVNLFSNKLNTKLTVYFYEEDKYSDYNYNTNELYDILLESNKAYFDYLKQVKEYKAKEKDLYQTNTL